MTPDLWSTGPRGPAPLRTFDAVIGNGTPGGGRDVGVTGPRGPASTSHERRRDQRRDPTGGRDSGDAGSGPGLGPLFAPACATHTMPTLIRTFQTS